MSDAKAVAGAEGEALAKLAKTGRALLEETRKAIIKLDGRDYYRLSTMALLELAAAVREAEALLG